MIFTPSSFEGFFCFARRVDGVPDADPAAGRAAFGDLFSFGFWNACYLILIFVSSCWRCGLGAAMVRAQTSGGRRFYLVVSLVFTLGTLAFFK